MRLVLTFPLSLALAASAAAQNVWHIDPAAAPPGDGSVASPFASIQFAIFQAAVQDGDELHLAPATYTEPITLTAKSLVFIGTGGAEVTVIDAGGVGSAVSVTGDATDGTRLEGLTLTHGGGTPGVWGTFPTLPGGGGLYVDDATVTVVDCVITGNEFLGVGGGCFAHDASVVFKDTRFEHNGVYFWSELQDGGAIFAQDSLVVANGCHFEDNNTFFGSGAVRARGGAVRLEASTFVDNAAGFEDGGAVLLWETMATVEDCRFEGNAALDLGRGGALACWSADVEVLGSRFSANEGDDGGAIYSAGSILDVRHSRFERNVAWEYDPSGFYGRGGALALSDFAPGLAEVRHSTFCHNRAEGSDEFPGTAVGGAVYGQALVDRCSFYGNLALDADGAVSGADVRNSILWGDSPNEMGGAAFAEYSNVQGGATGPGNVSVDPMYWLPDEGDLHLRPGSPMVDLGDPTQTDRDGSPVDLGAFPLDASYLPPTVVYCTAKTQSSGCLPSIGWSGEASASGASTSGGAITITCDGIDADRFGLAIWGLVPNDVPLFGGTLCVGLPIVRSGILHSGGDASPCSGSYTFVFDPSYLQSHGRLAGDVLYAQFYFRDPASPEQAGTSDAVRFSVAP